MFGRRVAEELSEDDDMSDEEFIEAFGKAMIEKCSNKLTESAPSNLDYSRYPEELNYDDLDVEVSQVSGGEPISDNRIGGDDISYSDEEENFGTINNYSYYIDDTDIDEIISKILNKPESELTQQDLDIVDINDFIEAGKELFRDKAENAARAD